MFRFFCLPSRSDITGNMLVKNMVNSLIISKIILLWLCLWGFFSLGWHQRCLGRNFILSSLAHQSFWSWQVHMVADPSSETLGAHNTVSVFWALCHVLCCNCSWGSVWNKFQMLNLKTFLFVWKLDLELCVYSFWCHNAPAAKDAIRFPCSTWETPLLNILDVWWLR